MKKTLYSNTKRVLVVRIPYFKNLVKDNLINDSVAGTQRIVENLKNSCVQEFTKNTPWSTN